MRILVEMRAPVDVVEANGASPLQIAAAVGADDGAADDGALRVPFVVSPRSPVLWGG